MKGIGWLPEAVFRRNKTDSTGEAPNKNKAALGAIVALTAFDSTGHAVNTSVKSADSEHLLFI